MGDSMSCNPIVVAGLEVPCDSPVFLTVLAVHIPFGLACVVTGIVAMLSTKGRGLHPTFGTMYYGSLVVVFASATALAAMRWAENYHLFILGLLSFTAAFVGRMARRRFWPGWVTPHIGGMGLSYILLLTAFYVDNGERLPLWKELPPFAYWLLPGAIGLPLIGRALWRHAVVQQPKGPRHVP
jgi:uncharacterized membrane protein